MNAGRRAGLSGAAALLVATLVSGCATLGLWDGGSRAEDVYEQGLSALERQQYREAYDHFAWVAQHHPREEIGTQAMLALAAIELDPRNEQRRLDVGAEILGRYFYSEATPAWQRPLLASAYLLALELGAKDDEVQQAREAAAAAEDEARDRRSLPSLSGPSVRAQLGELRGERTALRQENEQLKTRVSRLESQLAETKAELERIKKTIK